MLKEVVTVQNNTFKLNVENNKISSVYKGVNKQTGLRLYDKNRIGIAGVIGEADEGKLIEKAKSMLDFKIEYDVALTENSNRTVDLSNELCVSDKEFIDISNKLLDTLNKKHPQFNFSGTISLRDIENTLTNDCNTKLIFKDKYVVLAIFAKHKKSLNLMDLSAYNVARKFDYDDCLKACAQFCESYEKKVDIKDEKLPVIFDGGLVSVFYRELHGQIFANNSSLFSNKLGQKLFTDKFSLFSTRKSKEEYTNFFDGEGTTLANDEIALIENGVLKTPYTNKKLAKQFGYPLTSSASLVFDAVPGVGGSQLKIKSSGKTLKQLLNGQKAVLVDIASGGDFTSQGEYSTPVQAAYLYENGKIVGRLPQISVSSNVYKLFGEDFIGQATDSYLPDTPNKFEVYGMQVKKIGDWV
jgi:PmbA protein